MNTGPSVVNQPKSSANSQFSGENIRSSWTGKSLEGSAVKEPDPLDMSEEAKAERWFKRVAQIKDISELSQIPDEDFPSIMPMRKGVNRFVVSKRKTPLERRLTSQQYRRNLPIVSSVPVKKENDNS
ncbi:UNVERIFIED_CONTAM: Zinc finger protein VAR3, chloroplastic [Sesamum calycinum]